MTSAIIIALCVLLLAAYFFDLTASKTRIPSVILLLALGILFKHLTVFFGFQTIDLTNYTSRYGNGRPYTYRS